MKENRSKAQTGTGTGTGTETGSGTCAFCDWERYKARGPYPLASAQVDMGDLGRILANMSVCYDIADGRKPVMTVYMNQEGEFGDSIEAETDAEIRYCPVCGRKLA